MSGNPTLTNLANDSLRWIYSQTLTMLVTPNVDREVVGKAVITFRTTRTAAYEMLMAASNSNPGYEVDDFGKETREALSQANRILEVAAGFAGIDNEDAPA